MPVVKNYKIVMLFFFCALALTACDKPPALLPTYMTPSGVTTSDDTGTDHSSCRRITDPAACRAATGRLACAVNIWTNKCVESKWEHDIEVGKCHEVAVPGKCKKGSRIQISTLHPSDPTMLEVIGLCRLNADGTSCEEAPMMLGKTQICVPVADQNILEQSAAEICSMHQETGGLDGRIELKPNKFCKDISLGRLTHRNVPGLCRLSLQAGSKNCEVQDKIASDKFAGEQVIKNFCTGLIGRKHLVANVLLTELIEEYDYSACQSPLFLEDEGNIGQQAFSTTKGPVCRLADTP